MSDTNPSNDGNKGKEKEKERDKRGSVGDIPLMRLQSQSGFAASSLNLQAVQKAGNLYVPEKNSVRKIFFKSLKPYYVIIDDDKCLIYKDSTKAKLKRETSLLLSFTGFLQDGPAEMRNRGFFIRNAKGEEHYFHCQTEDDAKEWVSTLKNNIKYANNKLMGTLQFPNPPEGFEEKVLRMSWIREKTTFFSWRFRFIVLTDCAVYSYEKPPGNSSQLTSFSTRYPLNESKVREMEISEISEAAEESLKFAFVLISVKETSFIATDSKNENKNWINSIKTLTVSAVGKTREYSFNVEHEGIPCTFLINKGTGFTLKKSDGSVVWEHPFVHFKTFTSTKTALQLDFGKFESKISELISSEVYRISLIISLVLELAVESTRRSNSQINLLGSSQTNLKGSPGESQTNLKGSASGSQTSVNSDKEEKRNDKKE
jgi:hypothetical protein